MKKIILQFIVVFAFLMIIYLFLGNWNFFKYSFGITQEPTNFEFPQILEVLKPAIIIFLGIQVYDYLKGLRKPNPE